MESWYFIEYHCKEKTKIFLKEIESDRIAQAIKKRDSVKFHYPVIKPLLFLFKVFFYFSAKNVDDDG